MEAGDDIEINGDDPQPKYRSNLWVIFKNSQASDAGLYQCTAVNKVGRDSKTAYVKCKCNIVHNLRKENKIDTIRCKCSSVLSPEARRVFRST